MVPIDASLSAPNVSCWESLVERHVHDIRRENDSPETAKQEQRSRQSGECQELSRTAPDASMATNSRTRRPEPC